MGDQPTLLVGRVSDVGPDYVVLGKTRIELHADQLVWLALDNGHASLADLAVS